MNGTVNDLMEGVRKESEARSQALGRLFGAADASAVFAAPVSSGEYTVIAAAEVAGGGGFGSGMGIGGPSRRKGQSTVESPDQAAGEAPAIEGAGGGGGGGGGSMGRPVAVIVVGPEGVRVKPVLDLTKLSITALGAFGAVTALSLKIWSKK
jgi:uncharacterized spore protein YtfJ